MRTLDLRTQTATTFDLLRRNWSVEPEVESRVKEILEAVRTEGDEAVTTLTRQLDCRFIDSLGLKVSEKEIEGAYQHVSNKFLKALKVARRNISRFHKQQVQKSWTVKVKGMKLQQRFSPLSRVGIYVPGGKASYPSTVMMNALPARIAGVPEIVITTPCNPEGKIRAEVLVAAAECGITEMYRVGGAQAIAALAYGTESIRRVDKITGPGNAYVAAAKQMMYGRVGIDVIAGPTEVVVVADETANPAFVAADLIAQAEHDENAAAFCISISEQLVQQIEREVARQLETTQRATIARRSLDKNGVLILVGSMKQAADIVNELAPEHLEILTKNPYRLLDRIRNAGSIFIGAWSTEAMGDYIAGPNHTLPTSGTARFSSPLSVYDFMKFTNVIEIQRKMFASLAPHVETLAEAEGLFGHAASVHIRRKH